MNFDVYFHHVFVLFKDKAGILMKQNKNGFTLMEMLIVIAIIAVLIAVAIPVFASQLEKTEKRQILQMSAPLMHRCLQRRCSEILRLP